MEDRLKKTAKEKEEKKNFKELQEKRIKWKLNH